MADPYRERARRLRDLEDTGRGPSRRPARGPLLLLSALLLLLLIAAVFIWVESRSVLGARNKPAQTRSVTVTLDDKPIASESADSSDGPRVLEELIDALPRREQVRRDGGRLTVKIDRDATRMRVEQALAEGQDIVSAVARPVAARHTLPIIKQALRNNCETAALSMLLVAEGIKTDQLDLQRRLPSDGPLDPEPDGARFVWGDPDEGFVGRADGGGTSGGYGVYQGPVAELARAEGATPVDLSGEDPKAVYQRLLEGRPVMVWVGLTDGPYETWITPEGKNVTGNFGEHTVVLTGIDGDVISVNDPLEGIRTTWTKAEFEIMWRRLDRRALSL